MKSYLLGIVTSVGMIVLGACSSTPKSPDVADSIHNSLQQSGYKNVSVSQDRDKGVVTLQGNVPSDTDKTQAESIAKSMAAGQVVANEIAVLPPGSETVAKNVDSDLDGGIKKNLDAILIQHNLHDSVKYDVKQQVVTLSGSVASQSLRNEAQQIASTVPNVQQVVNKLNVKGQKATSSD